MTAQSPKTVVADSVLAKFTRIMADVTRRLIEGSLDPGRLMHLLHLVGEGVPKKPLVLSATGDGGVYVLESEWSWDNSHIEYATIELEAFEGRGFDALLAEDMALSTRRKRLLTSLTKLSHEQTRRGGRMRRLYRVHQQSRFTQVSKIETGVKRSADLHFVMTPICDFDDNGQPVPVSDKYDRV